MYDSGRKICLPQIDAVSGKKCLIYHFFIAEIFLLVGDFTCLDEIEMLKIFM